MIKCFQKRGDIRMRLICAVGFFLAIAAVHAAAQTPAPSMINAGILNPRAVTMPTPEYPESAREAKHGGIVAVNVVVDESGLVISAVADPYDQHTGQNAKPTEAERRLDPTLMQAAENVARQATFKPFSLKGVPVKFAGKLTYNFIADNSNLSPRVGDIYGPLLNGRAISLPEPEWPAEARSSRGPFNVVVHITLDETGKVVSAKAISGSPELRSAAEAAALKSEFKPYLFMGEPVQIRGLIQYGFRPRPTTDQP
jgi:outer membrane biosynthesis protein TonB